MTRNDTRSACYVPHWCWTCHGSARLPGVVFEPVVDVSGATEIARDVVVIPNRSVPLVPNVGVIGGEHSVLVVETGLGPRNASAVLEFATEYARGRRLYL